MSEDIVTRLRGAHQKVLPDWLCNDLRFRACYEIERLRAAIRHLYFNEGVCYGDNCEQCELVFGLCDDKAVRGE